MLGNHRISDNDRPGNRLLAHLPTEDWRRVRSHLRTLPLHPRQVLHKQGESLEHVYFPNSGIVSMATVFDDGAMVEAATVGDEGMVGVEAFLDDHPVASCETIVQVPVPHESAEAMSLAVFRHEIAEHRAFREVIARYLQTLQARIIRVTACNARHDVDQRCARWLLAAHDHMHGHDFHLSQEFLAVMLGVRRQSVSAVAAAFQEAGFITYKHGNIAIQDRRSLEGAACECYAVIRDLYRELPF